MNREPVFKLCGGTKANLSHLQFGIALSGSARAVDGGRQVWIFEMAAQTQLESYTELAEHCLWEAERTLDREVAHSLRALGERYRRMSERSQRQDAYR
jgi:hypothetical protein